MIKNPTFFNVFYKAKCSNVIVYIESGMVVLDSNDTYIIIKCSIFGFIGTKVIRGFAVTY